MNTTQNAVNATENETTGGFKISQALIEFAERWVGRFEPEIKKFFEDLQIKQLVDGSIGLMRAGETPDSYYPSLMNELLASQWNPVQDELIAEAKEKLSDLEQGLLNDFIGVVNMLCVRRYESAWFGENSEALSIAFEEEFKRLSGDGGTQVEEGQDGGYSPEVVGESVPVAADPVSIALADSGAAGDNNPEVV